MKLLLKSGTGSIPVLSARRTIQLIQNKTGYRNFMYVNLPRTRNNTTKNTLPIHSRFIYLSLIVKKKKTKIFKECKLSKAG